MLNLSRRYAKALLEYAEERGLGEIYRQALLLAAGRKELDPAEIPGGLLGDFLRQVPQEERTQALYLFLELARDRMDLLETEIISAVPLTPGQLANLEVRLIKMFRKQLDITVRVDPSLLGGLRVIVGNTVLDDTIKRKLQDMKDSVYKGVYMNQ